MTKSLRFHKALASVVLALASAACGGATMNSANSVVGTWKSDVSGVTITAVFSGSATSGTAQLTQTTAVGGDTATCRSSSISNGAYTVSGSSITITATSAHQTTTGCSFADTDTPISDLGPSMSFAAALSGPFVLTDTTLKLGASYPTLTRQP